MAWVGRGSRAFRVVAGVAVGVSAAAVVYKQSISAEHSSDSEKVSLTLPLNKVLASWTTNFKPSQEWDHNWDRREPKNMIKPTSTTDDNNINDNDYENEIKKVTPTASRHLILIRHGQYNMEPKQDEFRILTALGREQADLTGLRIKELGHPYDRLVHSTMSRAKETAQIILKHLPNDLHVDETDCLCEGAPFPPEPPVGHWRPEYYQFYQDGARIESAFRKLFHRASPKQEKDSYEIIVCHANVIRYFVCRALQVPPEAWLRMSLYHGSTTWITIRPSGRVALKTLGDAGFMPPDKLSST